MSSVSFSDGAVVVRANKRRGSGLERMTKSLGNKVAIHIPEGMKRPEQPVQAAKFATEGGLIARDHTPVLPHFKEYKKDKTMLKDYIGKVAVSYLSRTCICFFRSFCFTCHMITNLELCLLSL